MNFWIFFTQDLLQEQTDKLSEAHLLSVLSSSIPKSGHEPSYVAKIAAFARYSAPMQRQ
jgi:hypothetical protein